MRKALMTAGIFIVVAFLAMGGRMVLSQPQLSNGSLWPLPAGSTWLYRGDVTWSDAQSGAVQTREVEYSVEVEDVIRRNGLRAAVLHGHPQELAWYQEDYPYDQRREKYVIIEVPQGLFFVQGTRVAEVLPRLADSADPLTGLLRSEEMIARPDMKPGDVLGTLAGLRNDGLYQWIVEAREKVRVKKPEPNAQALAAFRLVLRTLPDDTMIDFVPGIGMTRYHYRHHGSVAEADLRLVDFDNGRPSLARNARD